jgi:hypothetical protein
MYDDVLLKLNKYAVGQNFVENRFHCHLIAQLEVSNNFQFRGNIHAIALFNVLQEFILVPLYIGLHLPRIKVMSLTK